MFLALTVILQTALTVYVHPWVFLASAPLTCILFFLFRKDKRPYSQAGALLVSLLPLFFISGLRGKPTFPSLRETGFDMSALDPDPVLPDSEKIAEILTLLESGRLGYDDPQGAFVLQDMPLPAYHGVTVLDLNYQPKVWRGTYFSNRYQGEQLRTKKFFLVDGRLFLRTLYPIPNEAAIQAYVAVDVLVLSRQNHEQKDTWLYQALPAYRGYQPTVVGPEANGFLHELASILGVKAADFEIHFIHGQAGSTKVEVAALLWFFGLFALTFLAHRELSFSQALSFHTVALLVLGVHADHTLDFITPFASYIFASLKLGNLFTDPFHFGMTLTHLFLVLQLLQKHLLRRAPKWSVLGFAVLLPVLWYVPEYVQDVSTPSLVHPLEAFYSTGAFITFFSFLFLITAVVQLLRGCRKVPYTWKLICLPLSMIAVLFIRPDQWHTTLTANFIWLLPALKVSLAAISALAVLLFYPNLVVEEQVKEREFVRNELLDEITLLGERNHFRMGRIIRKLDDLVLMIQNWDNEYLVEMFAEQCGLFEDEIDFALRLTTAEGRMIGQVDQHISLDRVPVHRAQPGIIETYQASPSSPSWMIFRQNLETDLGTYEFTAVLGNDYQNISLARRLRQLETSRYRSGDQNSHYFAYMLDVFDLEGNNLYSQGTSLPLGNPALARMQREPFFWNNRGRDTDFYFRGGPYIYRITHKATPVKMILVRFLAMMLAFFLLSNLVQTFMQRKRPAWFAWDRSFAMKMAAFMFFSSVVPTATLGWFLINSIQKNQDREQEAIARSKILTAKNLVRDISLSEHGEGFALKDQEAGDQNNQTRGQSIPIERFARLFGDELSLFVSGSLVKTSQPEIFHAGHMNRRIPFTMMRDLVLDKNAYSLVHHDRGTAAGALYAYTTFELNDQEQAVLAMSMIPFSRRQVLRWREQLEFSITILAGILFLMAGLSRFMARSFLMPVSAITRSAARIAKGIQNRPIQINRGDELQRMVTSFNLMQERIQESQNRLKAQLALLDETLKSMSGGLLGFDEHHQIILANDRAWELLSMKAAPQNVEELVFNQPGIQPLVSMLDAADNAEFSFTPKGKDNSLLVKLREVGSTSQEIQFIVVIEDITDALAANRFHAWSEMARRVAHEIKNPLTPIQLEMDHLVRMYQDKHPMFPEALQEAAEEIRGQVNQLRRIATEFGDYARPMSLEITTFSPQELIEKCLAPYQHSAEDLEVETDFEDAPDFIAADYRVLQRTVNNLIVNAVEAMNKQGRLGVRIFRLEEGRCMIFVEDTGPGIPPEEQARVFEAYFSTKTHGTGLGLAIAAKNIKRHGGSLSIDQLYTKGTRFVIDIPIVVQPEQEA